MILNDLPMWMAICLFTTLAVEMTGAYIIGHRSKKDIINVLAVNIITNPIVVVSVYFVGFFYGRHISQIYEYFVEAEVIAAEGLFYLKTLKKSRVNPFLLSVILNALSYGAGIIINQFV